MTEPDWAALDAAWLPARRAGVLGGATTESLRVHAAGYLPAACRVDDEFLGIDLGTGAGIPGAVLAALRPASKWTLVDASERRCEFAHAAVRALGLEERVVVIHSRAEDLAHDPQHRGVYDLVVARSFGPAAELAECGLPLVAAGGRLVVSVTDEIAELWLRRAGRLVDLEMQTSRGGEGSQYLAVTPLSDVPAAWPRRTAARRRHPLF